MFTIKDAIGELDRIRLDVNSIPLSEEKRQLASLVALELSSVMSFLGRIEERLKAYEESLKAYEESLEASEERLEASEERLKAYEESLKAYEESLEAYEEILKTSEESLEASEERKNHDKRQWVEITYEKWREEAKKRYPDDNIVFRCPVCNFAQSVSEYRVAGAPEGAWGYSCIGRWVGAKRKAFGGKKSGPCDYAGGGLFTLNPIQVIFSEVDARFIFDFADDPMVAK